MLCCMLYRKVVKKEINKKLPIIAESNNNKYLLLPQITDGYAVVGYNWFNLETMLYNSCCCFKTIDEAINSYSKHTIYNATLKIERR